jgi:hypothetical protein
LGCELSRARGGIEGEERSAEEKLRYARGVLPKLREALLDLDSGAEMAPLELRHVADQRPSAAVGDRPIGAPQSSKRVLRSQEAVVHVLEGQLEAMPVEFEQNDLQVFLEGRGYEVNRSTLRSALHFLMQTSFPLSVLREGKGRRSTIYRHGHGVKA